MTVSETSLNFCKPNSALSTLALSILKGIVTVPITIDPVSLATLATTAAEPVPVPPPIPAHTKTMSAPARDSLIWLIASFAASSPTFGNPPAPSPLVRSLPSKNFLSASMFSRCCTSVLHAMISAPLIPFLYSQLTILFPAPPQPITFMLACPTL